MVAASVPQYEWWCKETLQHALKNEPMVPEIFRFAFYLYGRVNLVRSAAIQMVKGGAPAQSKRSSDSGQMSTTRSMQIPLQMRRDDPMSLETKFCDVMMVDDQVAVGEEDAFKVTGSSEEKPGLAILDSGCTRSVHSAQWAETFEEELKKRGLKPKVRNKKQTFRGIGGNSESDIVKVFPVHLGGVPGELHSAETKEGNFPLLISRPFMEHSGTVINFKAGTVSFTTIGVSDLPLLKTSRGHLAVSLLDFDGGGRDQEAFTTVADEFPEWDSPTSQKGLSLPSEACRSLQQLEAEVPSQSRPETPEGYERGYIPTIPDSDNPDPEGDSPSYQDYIASLRMDVEGYEEFMRERGEDPYPHMDSGEHCDDPEHFEVLLSDQEFCVLRKATNKKQKRIAMMSAMLDAEEFNRLRKIRGEIGGPVPRKPHVGKTWLKQLFAGQMGLSVLAVFLGMQIGVPLDISSSCWDATTKQGKSHLHRDLLVEDPYVLVITHPCGPWGNWSRFNLAKGGASAETVNLLREENRPVLALVNKVVKDRVKAQRHVFLEQPLGSKSLEEPEMSDVKRMVEEEKLIFLRVDGCMVGYMDAESKKPHNKPSYYLTTMVAAENIFEGIRCDGSHEHEPLEGANRFGPRTAQAAEWPMKLNRLVLEAVIQQSEIEKNAVANLVDAFPAEVRQQGEQGGRERKRRRGRMAILAHEFETPPVYVRPEDVERPEVVMEPKDDDEYPARLPHDDHDFRAEAAASLDAVLNKTEGERRHEWLKIDPELRKIVRDLHVNFGHPTNVTLQRILRRQNAKSEAIRAAGLLACDSCGESIRRRRPKPVKLPTRYEFNRHLLVDTMWARDCKGESYGFLNIVDDATGYQVVCCFGNITGPPSSKVVLRHFISSWSSWAGLPRSLQVDRGKEFMAQFSDFLKQYGVEQEVMPLEAPWKGGKCEKAGGLWKELWKRTVHESQVCTLSDVITATAIVTQTRNSFPRSNGYSPVQWVLGVADQRLPGSLLDDEESQKLEVLEAAENPHSQMAKQLNIREQARVAQIRLDTDSRVRRALLHKSTPSRGPFPIGAYVYFFKLQPQRGDARNFKWFGPARVIGVELRNPRRLEDEDPGAEGGAPHSYWLRYGPSVVLATGEQLRFASEDELLAAHMVPEYAVQEAHIRGARGYADIRNPMTMSQIFGEAEGAGGDEPAPMMEELPASAVPGGAADSPGYSPTTEPGDPDSVPMLLPPQQLQVIPETIEEDQTMPTPVPEDAGEMSRQTTAAEPEPHPTTNSATATPRFQPTFNTQSNQPSFVQQQPSSFPQFGGPGEAALPLPPNFIPLQHPPNLYNQLNTALARDPELLDGHGPTRYRDLRNRDIREGRVNGPYLAEEEPWEEMCPGLEDSVRMLRLREIVDIEEESTGDEATDEDGRENGNPVIAEAFLTGKAIRSEIRLGDLGPGQRSLFDEAMKKEWSSWMKFSTVEVMTPDQIAELPEDTKIIGTRWVHVDKNNKRRLIAKMLAKKTGKTQEQIDRENPLEAKSRIVVQGCQEEETGIRSDSPTASLLAFNLVSAIAVMNKWEVRSYDASTAYLQAKGIDRLLILKPPKPPPPGVSSTDLLRAKGSIYGTKDAGRSWWFKLLEESKKEGWIQSSIESATSIYMKEESYVGS